MRTAQAIAAALAVAPLVACDQSASSDSRPLGSPPGAPPGAPVMQPTTAPSAASEPARGPLAQEQPLGQLEAVATFDRAMPTGVAVSREGRVFVSFPRWSDPIDTSVAEVKTGLTFPYPDARWNPSQPGEAATTFVGVQSVVVDAKNRLWVLDTGTINMGRVIPGGAKLVAFDLASNKPVVTIALSPDVALPTSYLNDVRVDVSRGKAGFAFVSDSSPAGPNAIVVVDIDAKKAWRRLVDHPSVKPQPGFLAIVEGRPLYAQRPGQAGRTPFAAGVDGIEISPDGKWLYYSPLASRRLYSASADALSDMHMPDSEVAQTVKDLGDKGVSDGLIMAADGTLYATEIEHDGIARRLVDGTMEALASDPRLLWPDSMAIGPDGYLYVTANQLERQPMLQNGQDLRQRPYVLMRIKTDAAPVRAHPRAK
jgi:sugar lactone lactonase YvrE